ncbi:MAG: site-specific integrase [Thermodesulfovibrio sp.]|nr:site-specific integrase [Thermodesulfovibrio sp.]MDW7997903.1 site-specific integrase [Thermodesulfovibrio sp.]
MKTRGVFKRGSIYWIRYADPTGRVIRESAKTRNINEALKLLAKRKAQVAEGKYPEKVVIKNYTFSELCDRYNNWATIQRCYEKDKKYIIQELKEKFGSLILRRFTTHLLEQYQVDLAKQGLKPATINKKIACIKHMFTKAVEWDMVEEEVLKRIRRVKFLKEDNKRLRYLTEEEIHSLLSHCDKHLYPIVFTALNTGMRKDEILSLKWDNVDLKNGYIHVEKTKNSERRDIPMNSHLLSLFKELFKNRKLGVDYVFVNPETNTRYYDIKRSFKHALRKAKITDFKFHDLRHTFASHLVMNGVDLATVKELLGHKDIKMTLRYSHLAPEHKNKAVSCLNKIFATSKKFKCTKTDTVGIFSDVSVCRNP